MDIVRTAVADLKGVARVGKDLMSGALPLREVGEHLPLVGDSPTRIIEGVVEPADAPAQSALLHQLVRFALVGIASTVAFALLFLLLRGPMGAQGANVTALLLTAVANTAAHRRVTFGFRGSAHVARHHGQGLLVFFLVWALTSGSLALLAAAAPAAPHVVELAVLVVANLAATVVRFVLLRRWVFRPRPSTGPTVGRAAIPCPTPTLTQGALR